MNEKEIRDIALEDIIPNRFQPREIFDESALNELAQSIREHGVIQPIIVRSMGDKYEIVSGERRYKASTLAGKATIPCIVRDLDDVQSSKIALLENLQRKDLTPIEEARTYQLIIKLGSMTQDQLAKSIGKSQSAIANKMRLLTLDEDVQSALLSEQISERHARSLLNIGDKEEQKRLLEMIVKTRMTVKELDDEIMKIKKANNITNQVVEPPKEDDDEGGSWNFPETENMPSNKFITGNNIDVDVQSIKNNAVDISPQNDFADINSLLKTSNPIKEEPKIENANKFIPNIKPEIESEEKEFIEDITKSPLQQEVNDILANSTPEVINKPNLVEEEPIETLMLETVNKPNEQVEVPSNNQNFGLINNDLYSKKQENEVYDLRFAINNIRQAVQSTEKFGFVIDTEEFDFENMYQIIIKIDKNK